VIDQETYADAVRELLGAGADLAELVGLDWTTIPRGDSEAALERWQRALVRIASLHTQISNEVTE
jgi:hypothetical protein